MIVAGIANLLEHNLLVHNMFTGTYLDRYESSNFAWSGALDIRNAINVQLIGNVIAGSERIGLQTKGLSCTDNIQWRDNVIHSCFTGILMTFTPEMDCRDELCTMVTGFTIYKSYAFGIYTQISCNLHLKDLVFVDNTVSAMPMILYPDAVAHDPGHKNVTIEGGLFVGLSPHFDCERDVLNDHDREHLVPGHSGMGWCIQQDEWDGESELIRNGRVGVGWPSFLSTDNMMPDKVFHYVKFESILYGSVYIKGMKNIAVCTTVNTIIMEHFQALINNRDKNHMMVTINIRVVTTNQYTSTVSVFIKKYN